MTQWAYLLSLLVSTIDHRALGTLRTRRSSPVIAVSSLSPKSRMKVANVAAVTQARIAIAESRAPLRSQTSFWVAVREAFWNALGELRSHKLRSFLTLLGVVIATTTLIVVMSVVNGMNLYIATKIANLGTNTFVLFEFKWAQGYDSYLKALRRNRPIRIEEYQYLRETLTGYEAMSAIAQLNPGPEARYEGHSIDEVTLMGITPSHADIGREKVALGPLHFSDQDYRHNDAGLFYWPGHRG